MHSKPSVSYLLDSCRLHRCAEAAAGVLCCPSWQDASSPPFTAFQPLLLLLLSLFLLLLPLLSPRLQSLRLDAEPLSDAVLRLKIGDAASQRWQVPQWLLASELLPGASGNSQGKTAAASRASSGHQGAATSSSAGAAVSSTGRLFELSVKQDPFSLEVTRSQSPAAGRGEAAEAGRTVFNSTATRLVFKARGAGPGVGGLLCTAFSLHIDSQQHMRRSARLLCHRFAPPKLASPPSCL
jgi:hypothetical protein